MSIDHCFLGPMGDSTAIVYRDRPFCEPCADVVTTGDLVRMFTPVDQEEADRLGPVAQAYLEATMQRIIATFGTRCRRCRIDVGEKDYRPN